MLEQMRKSSQSLLIYVLFGIVIAVFIINFGPQSRGGCDAPASKSSYAAKVNGQVISSRDFRYGFILYGGLRAQPEQAKQFRLRERIMDALIDRELLAGEAERLGFRVGTEEVEDLLLESKMIMPGGFEQTEPGLQKNGVFDHETYKKFVQYSLSMSPKAFVEEQRREMLATRLRAVLRGGVNVSVDEVKGDYERKNNQVNLEYVRYNWRRYENEIELQTADIEAYAKAEEKKLKDLYEQRKFLYENVPKERRLRQILVKLDTGASPEAEKAAQKKAQGLADRIKKGEDFAAVAKAASDDARSKKRGGDVGWKRQGATTLGAPVEEKVWAAKEGEVVGPMKSTEGFYLVVAEGSREGTLPFDKVRLDMAENELRQEKAKGKAKAEAEAALARAKGAKDKTLKDLFPAPPEKLDTGEGVPRAEETGLFVRQGSVVEGIGTAPELAKAAFSLSTEAPFAGPFEVSSSYVVAKLKEHKQPDMGEFEKKKGELLSQAAMVRGEEVLAEWTRRRCVETKEAKHLDVNLEILRYDDTPQGRPAYEACQPLFRN
jgi:peptidyl-prolyl cis-trans isomerase D